MATFRLLDSNTSTNAHIDDNARNLGNYVGQGSTTAYWLGPLTTAMLADKVHDTAPIAPIVTDHVLHEEVLDGQHPIPLAIENPAQRENPHIVRSRASRQRLNAVRADRSSSDRHIRVIAAARACEMWKRLAGTLPILDAEGNPLTGDAHRRARIDLNNRDVCRFWAGGVIDGKNTVERQVEFVRTWLAEEQAKISGNFQEAREQMLDAFDAAMTGRLLHLFDGASEPSGDEQRAAKDAALIERQKLVRALRTATTVTAAATARDTAISAVNAITVATGLQWSYGSGEPMPTTISYTKGTGKNKWKAQFHAHTATRSDALSLAAGMVLLDDFTHPEFEVVGLSNRATDGDLSFTLQRKTGASGHPAAGTYTLRFTVRSLLGPNEVSINVVVS